MKSILLIIILFFTGTSMQGQKTCDVRCIDSVILQIEKELPLFTIKNSNIIRAVEDSDDPFDSVKTRKMIYYDSNKSIQKIVENVNYGHWTYLITVYYQAGKTLKYQRLEKYKDVIKYEFEIYWFKDSLLLVNNKTGVGKPYPDAFLSFSYQLLKSN